MKGTSRLVMGATLIAVASLALVLALIVVLLVELYCSFSLRNRLRSNTTATTTTTNLASSPHSQQHQDPSTAPPPLRSIYAQGVLWAPRSYLFPTITSKEEENTELKKHHSQFNQPQERQTQQTTTNTSPHHIGLIPTSSPSPSFVSITSPAAGGGDHFVYISNPIYDNEACRLSRVGTPFETPDTSPSRLGIGDCSGDDDENAEPSPSSTPSSLPMTPPLTPMKKLPLEACSVSLRDARSLGTSRSGSDSNNGLSSSSSGSPCTSPSW